jgi:hypothetical protein
MSTIHLIATEQSPEGLYVNHLNIPLLQTSIAQAALEARIAATPEDVARLDALVTADPQTFALAARGAFGSDYGGGIDNDQHQGKWALATVNSRISDVRAVGYHTVRMREASRIIAPAFGRGLGLLAVQAAQGSILKERATKRHMSKLADMVRVDVYSLADLREYDREGDDEALYGATAGQYPTPITLLRDGRIVAANYLG